MNRVLQLAALAGLAGAIGFAAPATLAAQASYKRELPDSLVKRTKITETAAAKTALARVPNGTIEGVELEQENAKLIYSYDIKVKGKSGIDEVNVSAITGKVIAVSHETPATEKKEAADDAKAAKAAKPAKKPPATNR